MKRKFLQLLIGLLASIPGIAQRNFDYSLVPDSLKKDANAVVRSYSTIYNRLSVEEYTLTVNYVATILNEKGSSAAELLINYDNNSEVADLQGAIYDEKGIYVKSIKKKNFNDYAFNNSFTLYSDNRVKQYSPSATSYPYTVAYTYSIEYKSTVGFPIWFPQMGFGVSAEEAELVINTPEILGLNHMPLNYPFRFEETTSGTSKHFKWTATALKAITYEPGLPDHLDIFPSVLLSPNDIAYEGTTGNFTSWEDYGKWVYSLIDKRDGLPAETLAEIKLLTGPIADAKEKAEALYKYMQQKTRYVNIALGIGGFQPMAATEVHQKGYGDCKALSNYMKALLNGIGIEAYYTEIGSGAYRKIKFPEFPSVNQTNHVILCMPNGKDTIWLECTNQNLPFGYIGANNSDRYSLLVTPNGGKLARTPTYETRKNTRNSNIQVSLFGNGSARIEFTADFRNYLYEDVFYLIGQSKEEQKKELLKTLSRGDLQIDGFSLTDVSGDDAKATLQLNGQMNSYAVTGGNRIFVEPNLMFRHAFAGNQMKNRKQNLYEAVGYAYNDTLNLTIPLNTSIEFLPNDNEFSSPYGSYKITYQKLGDTQIRVSRQITIHKGNFPPEEFGTINAFLTGVLRQDKEKIVLLVGKT
ncbi:DUF3857 domain-containing transglutaminase family protein [Gaoshiqia sediminis]|uniref:DUF3857 domain-containing transglutaminase family protein n=1 Tax=Gaoshiqia sediminis TaxID=2986998 RepID=A0AA41Y3E5_9BACT|nr:DUF3857 domain-containing transglutaminase family protein [Gaoshiqia sediminis]MCW0481119.1 DUF3857 domain-containing transglutaminase family protein [Gaoshiqia sediminis]